ncbi:MAG: ribosome maturation factor RimM [Gammaproteobacteria bacterium]|nr:ribosome maturation factor RimM [Gammaproteobacteria bacterium]
METTDWVQLGKITGLYGVKGWVKVFSYTDPRDNILQYPRWFLDLNGKRTEVELDSGRVHGKGIVVRIQGVEDRELAAQWLGAKIEVPRSHMPASDDGRWYWMDLIGLQVVTTGGVALGQVSGLLETGANDVLVVQGDRERLVPFVMDQYVKRVDLDAAVIEVDWDPEF